jgi:hypothetical protein
MLNSALTQPCTSWSYRVLKGIAASSMIVACGANDTTSPAEKATSVVVDPLVCPASREDGRGKVFHEQYLQAHADQAHKVTVTLRAITWSNPACDSDEAPTGCPDRDQALREREELNIKQLQCVREAFGPPEARGAIRAEWYEQLETPGNGPPTPIGVAFSTLAMWSQLEAVAQHPYVQRIDPAPGQSAKLGIMASAIPSECPAAADAPEAKTMDAASIRGQGRQSGCHRAESNRLAGPPYVSW